MLLEGITQTSFITDMSFRLKKTPTDEQIRFFSDFRSPMICFASPGTGKTTSAIMGLINAEVYHQVSGDSIYALSFTRMATAELSVRHKQACQTLGMAQRVHFQTLHSLCTTVLKENYIKLGIQTLDISGSRPVAKCCDLLTGCCNTKGIKANLQMLRSTVMAIRILNNSMIFDEHRVRSALCFKETKMKYEDFTELRKYLFIYNYLTGSIPVDDILLYTLMLFIRHPEVSEEWKKKCKIMLVDEAQDLSLLQLRVISMMTANPILIGDMKQQIYGFNGACSEIVDWFRKIYPRARETELSQSFRCKNEIAEWATRIILPNKLDAERFNGTGEGGTVTLVPDIDLDVIAKELHDDYVSNNLSFTRDVMFLFRNNASSIPVAEALYHAGVPFRINKYMPAYEMDVVKDILAILNMCKYPTSLDYMYALRYVIPEFKAYVNVTQNPFYMKCKKDGCSIFEVNYDFKDAGSAHTMMLLNELSERLYKGDKMINLFNAIWKTYYESYLRAREWMLEYPTEYYIRTISPLLRNKTYEQFCYDETEKFKVVQESERYHRGVRCYTMHAAKGLEADDVYILDSNQGIIPNDRQLDRMCKLDCDIEASLSVRNERSLCYVACTRAKENLKICYTDQVAPMLVGENTYTQLDYLYGYYRTSADDLSAFMEFIKEAG